MKKLVLTLVLVALVLSGCRANPGGKEIIHVGINQYVEFGALDDCREGFIQALEDQGYKDGDNISIDYQNAQADMPTAQAIAQQMASDQKDLIFAIATPSAQASYNATKDIPILVSAVTDPVMAEIVESMETPNTNVSGTSDYLPVERQVELIKMMVPHAKKIGVMYNTSEVNSEVQVEELKKAAIAYDVIASGVTSTNDIKSAVSALVGKIDVLYVPTDNLVVSAMPLVAKTAVEAEIPVIASEGGSVEDGALATVGINYYNLGYETGKMAVEVLEGADISKMPVKIMEETDVFINEGALKALGMEAPNIDNIVYVK